MDIAFIRKIIKITNKTHFGLNVTTLITRVFPKQKAGKITISAQLQIELNWVGLDWNDKLNYFLCKFT